MSAQDSELRYVECSIDDIARMARRHDDDRRIQHDYLIGVYDGMNLVDSPGTIDLREQILDLCRSLMKRGGQGRDAILGAGVREGTG